MSCRILNTPFDLFLLGLHEEHRAYVRRLLGREKETSSSEGCEADMVGLFLRKLYDHEFAFSEEEMHEDCTMFFNILFPIPPDLVNETGVMIDHDRRPTVVLESFDLEQQSGLENGSVYFRYYYLQTRKYLWEISSVCKHRGELLTSLEKLDIREPFARQRIFDIAHTQHSLDWNQTARPMDGGKASAEDQDNASSERTARTSDATEEAENAESFQALDIWELMKALQESTAGNQAEAEAIGGGKSGALENGDMSQSVWE